MAANEGNELIKLCVTIIVLFLLIAGVTAVFAQIDAFGRGAVETVTLSVASAELRHYAGQYNGAGIHTLVASGLPVHSPAGGCISLTDARNAFSALRSYTVTWLEIGGSERLVVS
jgi:hypothetical protein